MSEDLSPEVNQCLLQATNLSGSEDEINAGVAGVLGSDTPVVARCIANLDSEGKLVSLVANNGFIYQVTRPEPGPIASEKSGPIIWNEMIPGKYSFAGNEGDGCYIFATGGAILGGSLFRTEDRKGLKQKGRGTWKQATDEDP